jgi:glyoxylase-like metal-dependent hydrolase (beta-lactamase superfamily II)
MRAVSARWASIGISWGLLLLLGASANSAAAQAEWDIRIEQLRGSVHVVTATRGADRVNLVASVGPDGVLLSDAGVAAYATALSAELRELTGDSRSVRHIINTHYHGDHTGGNKALGAAATVYAHPATYSSLRDGSEFGPSAEDARVPDVLVGDSLEFRFNDELVRVLHVPAAHTEGDLVVHFMDSDVLHVGDLVLAPRTLPYSRHPHSHARGLERLSRRATAETLVVTGHGGVVDRAGLRDLAAVMHETINAARGAVHSGTSLEALLEDHPAEWHAWESRFLSVDEWLTTLYRDADSAAVAGRERTIEGVHEIDLVAPGVYVAVPRFGSANATIIINDDHVVLVDPHSTPAGARALAEEVAMLTPLPVRYIVNTHWHSDHHGGNAWFAESFPDRITFVSHPSTVTHIASNASAELRQMASFYSTFADAADRVLATGSYPDGTVLGERARIQVETYVRDMRAFVEEAASFRYHLPDTSVRDRLVLDEGGRRLVVTHPGPAHTDGDLLVHLPDDGVLITGDMVTAPYVVPRSADISGYIRALRALPGLGADSFVLGHGGPVKRDLEFAGLMAEFLEACLAVAELSIQRGLGSEAAVTAAEDDPALASFESRIDWDEPGLRFLDFAGLVRMTVARAYQNLESGR